MPDQKRSNPLLASVTSLKGVGPKLASKLEGLGISNVQDILFHLPLRYQDRTRITPIGALQLGQDAVIEGEVLAADIVFGRRRSLVCRLRDGTGSITLRFFHFNASQKQQLSPGSRVRCFGEARRGSAGLELYHPEYQVLSGEESPPVADRLSPIYPSTEGLHQASWRKLSSQALAVLAKQNIADQLPPSRYSDIDLGQALQLLHAPPPSVSTAALLAGEHPAQRRLALEELLAHHLALQELREETRRLGAGPIQACKLVEQQFLADLPFSLTRAQARVCDEIYYDLGQAEPMLRLVQGDVGSGKTLVAACAALRAIGNHHQVAVMAPTEILAEQLLQNFQNWFEPLGISCELLVGKIKGKKREAVLSRMAKGQCQLMVGTHALFQDDVEFNCLGLVIIDEQHRFGVHQRLSLQQKGSDGCPHQLIMTATPIPRTLAMTAYADLDTSVIDELPPGRKPINTVVLANERRGQVIERVRQLCASGQQAYWVCTLIEESENLQAQAAEKTWEELCEALSELQVGLIHGRMKPTEKEAVMQRFKAGELQLLVATTVIEVGVDVPNASLMIIENAERLGLAQLHQLRGRVGRGAQQSHCVLLYQAPLSRNGRARLQILRESNDGFVIAEKDLALRGPGEVLGTRQTGLMDFRIAELPRDNELLDEVKDLAQRIRVEQPRLGPQLIRRWLGNKTVYGSV